MVTWSTSGPSVSAPIGMNEASQARQRVDKWLWFARIVKSRTLATKLVAEGRVRLNAVRIENAAKTVGAGDVLTIALEREVKVLRILGHGQRRGPYSEARLLYVDLNENPSGRESPDEPPQGS
jgi:ribosome-associated heat shock protein Hsp15